MLLECDSSNNVAMDTKAKLVARINRSGDVNDPGTPRPLVTLEEFFEGNDDASSIGCNLLGGVTPNEFYSLLKTIRDRQEVADVLIQVTMHDDPDAWPHSDTVWVITSATADSVRSWVPERLAPDDVFDGFPNDRQIEDHSVPAGMRGVGLWYD